MTATHDGSLIERLTEAAGGYATEGSVDYLTEETRRAPLPLRRGLSAAEREAITNESVGRLLEIMEFTTDRLQNSMHRIGYLESKVETYEGQLSFMPEFRAKAARCLVLERENEELKAQLELRTEQLIKRERLIHERDEQVSILEKLLGAYRKHLTMVEADLHRLENSSWMRFCAWFTGERF